MSDVPAAVASGVLAAVAGSALGRSETYGWTHPFMHFTLASHGILGVLHYLKVDTGGAFKISLMAAKYLALPGLNCDLYRKMYENEVVPTAFVLSAVIPFWLEMNGIKKDDFGRAMIIANIIALGYYSVRKDREWAWYTLGCSILALLITPVAGANMKGVFPLACAGMDYCAHRLTGCH